MFPEENHDIPSAKKKRKRRVYESRYPYYVIVLTTMLVTAIVVAALTWRLVAGTATPVESMIATPIEVVGCSLLSVRPDVGLSVFAEPDENSVRKIGFSRGVEATGIMPGWYRVVFNGYHGWTMNDDRSATEGNCERLPLVSPDEVPPLPVASRTDGCWLYVFHQAFDKPGTPLYSFPDTYTTIEYLPVGAEVQAVKYSNISGVSRYKVQSPETGAYGWVESNHITNTLLCSELPLYRTPAPPILHPTVTGIPTYTPTPIPTVTPAYVHDAATPRGGLSDCQMRVREATQLNAMLNNNRWIADLVPGEIVTARLYGEVDGYARYQVLTGHNKVGWVDATLLYGTCSTIGAPTPVSG